MMKLNKIEEIDKEIFGKNIPLKKNVFIMKHKTNIEANQIFGKLFIYS